MYQEERLLAIQNYLRTYNRISVEEICSLLDVSRDTARRDLVKLEQENAIVRTRGGAILPSIPNEVKDYSNRLKTVSKEKKSIGKLAASLIKSGDRIILDASTTVHACAEQIADLDCTVITNSIHQAETLSNRGSVKINLLGGELQKEHKFLFGASVVEKLSQYHVDKAFIGVVGISQTGLTNRHEEDGMVKRKMVENAGKVIVLADHTKFGVIDFFRFAKLNEVDLIITDQEPNKDFLELLDKTNVQLMIADCVHREE